MHPAALQPIDGRGLGFRSELACYATGRYLRFYADPDQQRVAKAYVAQLQEVKSFSRPIVTELAPLNAFYPAEAYHQNYLAQHPENMYIVINDLPKLGELRKQFPDLYVNR